MDKKDAGAIKRKIILQMLIFTVCVLGVGLTLYMLCTSAGVAAFFRDTLSVDLTGFQSSVGSLLAPGSMGMVLFIVVLTLLLVFLLYLGFSSRVLRYLRGVGAGVDRMLGVDALLDGEALFGGGDHSDVGPRLPKEMFSVGKKLEMLQKSLSSREQAVRTAHQRKNRLVVNLAAEVRVPLANLTDCLAMVNDEPYMPYERKAECTAAAIEKAYELDELIDDFFELTRYNMGKTELSSKLVDLNQMFAQIIDLIRPLLVKQGKDVVVNAGEGSAVFGDPEKIARAFYGILKKALAFSNAKSVIYVEASVRDGRTNVDVTCYGETVSQEMLDALLENFYRAQEKPLLPGKTGLGLSVAHEIVLLHRGGMMAQSAEGKTVFTVSLPMAPAMGRGFEVSDVSEYVASMAKGLSISRSAQRNEGRKNKLALMSGGQGRTLGPVPSSGLGAELDAGLGAGLDAGLSASPGVLPYVASGSRQNDTYASLGAAGFNDTPYTSPGGGQNDTPYASLGVAGFNDTPYTPSGDGQNDSPYVSPGFGSNDMVFTAGGLSDALGQELSPAINGSIGLDRDSYDRTLSFDDVPTPSEYGRNNVPEVMPFAPGYPSKDNHDMTLTGSVPYPQYEGPNIVPFVPGYGDVDLEITYFEPEDPQWAMNEDQWAVNDDQSAAESIHRLLEDPDVKFFDLEHPPVDVFDAGSIKVQGDGIEMDAALGMDDALFVAEPAQADISRTMALESEPMITGAGNPGNGLEFQWGETDSGAAMHGETYTELFDEAREPGYDRRSAMAPPERQEAAGTERPDVMAQERQDAEVSQDAAANPYRIPAYHHKHSCVSRSAYETILIQRGHEAAHVARSS